MEIADRCVPWETSIHAENLVLQALKLQAYVITDRMSALWRINLMLSLTFE
jgi:hypothetical protein